MFKDESKLTGKQLKRRRFLTDAIDIGLKVVLLVLVIKLISIGLLQ